MSEPNDPIDEPVPDATPAAPETPAGPAAMPRYVRDREHAVVVGVAAGLAAATGVDISIIRIAFVVAGLLHGAGILAYVAAWGAMPSREDALAGRRPHWPSPSLVVCAGLGLAALLVLVAPFDLGTGVLPTLLLIGVGIALWQSTARDRIYPPTPGGAAGAAPSGPLAPLWLWLARPPRPPQPRSRLGRLTAGLTLLGEAVALGLDRAGVLHFTPERLVSLGLVVLGGGLVVGTVVGRARWLALPALALVPVAVALGTFHAMGLDPFTSVGPRLYSPPAAAEVRPAYRNGSGDVAVDLSGVQLAGATRTAAVETAVGDVDVWVPAGAALTVDAETALGVIDVPGTSTPFGLERRGSYDLPGTAGGGRLRLRLRTGLGTIRVHRGPQQPPIVVGPA